MEQRTPKMSNKNMIALFSYDPQSPFHTFAL